MLSLRPRLFSVLKPQARIIGNSTGDVKFVFDGITLPPDARPIVLAASNLFLTRVKKQIHLETNPQLIFAIGIE